MGVFMRDSDAFTWYMERDPMLRSTVVAVAWLESGAGLGRARREAGPRDPARPDASGSGSSSRPAGSRRPGGPSTTGFDLTWHLRRVDAPAPHTPRHGRSRWPATRR